MPGGKDIFEFEKSLLVRLEEAESILCCKHDSIPASKVRSEWSNFIEVAIEPAGWQAIWKIPRVICEELKIQYPTVVYGTVDQVQFSDLSAVFIIEAVQEDEIHLPEKHEVALEELWPTKSQENNALNIDMTADSIDKLRFFYNHIWMPWDYDNDDDQDWASKHLESRIKFYYDIKNKTMSRALSSHIRTLLSEANYIQKSREYLELDIDDNQDMDVLLEETHITKLMRLHLRLSTIKSEIDMLENPEMRKIFEIIRFPGNDKDNMASYIKNFDSSMVVNGNAAIDAYVVSHIGSLDQQIEYLVKAKPIIGSEKIVRISSSLQIALDNCKSSDEIYIPPGKHSIKFLQYLNDKGSIKAITDVKYLEQSEAKFDEIKNKAVIISHDDDSILLTVDGDFTFENVVLDCHNVRTGVLVKRGNVTFKNCFFTGDPKSSSKQGIVVFGDSSLFFEDCVIKYFASGIYCNSNSKINIKCTTISDCFTGIELLNECELNFNDSKVQNCKQFGLVVESYTDAEAEKTVIFNEHSRIARDELVFSGECEFKNNAKGNIAINNNHNAAFNNSCFDPKNLEIDVDRLVGNDCTNKRKNSDSY